MSKISNPQPRRPILITIICVLGFLGAALILSGFLFFPVQLSNQLSVQYGAIFMPLSVCICGAGFIGLIGLWQMRRWGMYTYVTSLILGTILGLLFGISDVVSYVITFLTIVIIFKYSKQMR